MNLKEALDESLEKNPIETSENENKNIKILGIGKESSDIIKELKKYDLKQLHYINLEEGNSLEKEFKTTSIFFILLSSLNHSDIEKAIDISLLAKKENILSVAILPFSEEEIQNPDIQKFQEIIGSFILLPKKEIGCLEEIKDVSNFAQQIAYLCEKMFSTLIKMCFNSFFSQDWVEIKKVFQNQGRILFGFVLKEDNGTLAAKKVLETPLLKNYTHGIQKILIHIIGPEDFSLMEAQQTSKTILETIKIPYNNLSFSVETSNSKNKFSIALFSTYTN